MSNPGGVNLKGWTIHSTVPFPMLEKRDTVITLSRSGVGPEIYLSAATLDPLPPGAAGKGAGGGRAPGNAHTKRHAPLRRPRGIVMHCGYSDWLFDFDGEAWLAGAKRTVSEVTEAAGRAGGDIYIENVFDDAPHHIPPPHAFPRPDH